MLKTCAKSKLSAHLLSGLSCGQSRSPARIVFIRDVGGHAKTIETKENDRYLVSDQKLIDQLRNRFDLIRRDSINWRTTFLDKETGDNWLYYFTDTQLHGGAYPMMSKLPFPETDKLMEIALASDNEDEVFAACRTLVNNEKIDKQEFRTTLINKLELISDSSRQRKVIKSADLDSPMNMKSQLLKSADQVSRDASDFRAIAERAKRLLE